jgi:magnesium transporter
MITIIQYNEDGFSPEKLIEDPLTIQLDPSQKYWINVEFAKLDMSRSKNLLSVLQLPETIIKDIEAMRGLNDTKSREMELPRFYVEKGFSFFHANMIALKPKPTTNDPKSKENETENTSETNTLLSKKGIKKDNAQGNLLYPIYQLLSPIYKIIEVIKSFRGHTQSVNNVQKQDIFNDKDLSVEHICIIAKDHDQDPNQASFLLTFQQGNEEGDFLQPVRYTLKDNLRSIRNHPPHHLFYEVMDTILKQYFVIISEIRNHVEDLETKLFEDDHLSDNDDILLKEIMGMKSVIRVIRRYSIPLKTALEEIKIDHCSFSVIDHTKIYYEVVFDKVNSIIAYCDHSNDLFKDLMDLHLSLSGAQMNKIMKTLTLVSAIFIPLTFIAGLYGMNFQHMPELSWQYGYLFAWILMLVIAFGSYLFISSKKWI